MRFLLIYPPADRTIIEEKFSFEGYTPPLGILYLASSLEEEGHRVEIIDFSYEKFDNEKLKRKLNSVDVVGITVLTYTVKTSTIITKTVKNSYPEVPVLIGGPHCLIEPEKALLDIGADICVVGEGERVIKEIAKMLENDREPSGLTGVYYKHNGRIVKGKPLEVIEDLDSLSFPSRHLVEQYDYGYMIGVHLPGGRFTSVMTSRGCPFNCRFCLSRKYPIKRYRTRSPENVIEEIKKISETYDSMLIADDNFLADKKRVKKIMDMIKEEKIDIEIWIEGVRVDSTDKELFKKMKESGVKAIEFGIESGNQDVLDFYNKQITLPEIQKAVQTSRETGFITLGNFIFGAPIETTQHFENTIKFAKSLPLDIAFFYILEYLEGCDIWEDAVKTGKINPEQPRVESGSIKGQGNFTRDELERWKLKANKEFYLNPRYIAGEIYRAFERRDMRMLKAGWKLFLGEESIFKD
ncbi:MAG: radical SAM protein [Euryarchaeota archaeon]|nr:radical SAM protein [Euryarchaeota archaeon]